MNEHLVSTEADGYTCTLGISRASLRVAGFCALLAGAVLAVLINTTEPFRVPLGIALGVLAITLLVAYAVNSSSRAHKLEPPPTEHSKRRQVRVGRMSGKKSLAVELALLAELHGKGALSDEEFSAAKRRILGGR
jgi:Short C-terminal domain